MATSIEPHLWTDDFWPMIGWYRDTLGFEANAWSPDEATANWCQLRHGDASVMIAVTPDPSGLPPGQDYLAVVADRLRGPGGPLSLYLRVTDADTIYSLATAAEADLIEDIWNPWWGGRQFTVADPDGNWWTVYQPVE